MSNVFDNVSAQDETEEDRIGGGYSVKPTGIYSATIKAAYIQNSNSPDAKSQAIVFVLDVEGDEIRDTQWFKNRKGEVTYTKDGKKHNLPGYNAIAACANLVVGKALSDLDTEEKTLKVYDYEAKKEVNKEFTCFVEFHGEKVDIALQHQIVDKQKKEGNEYVNTGETRDENVVVKYLVPESRQTISEIVAFIKTMGTDLNTVLSKGQMAKAISKAPEAGDDSYAVQWATKNEGKPWDRSKGAKGGAGKSFESKSSNKASEEEESDLFG